ncbi:MAG TPA: serine hydrolase [Bacillota bacterium]|nr:serine hydrolase [Bacillota bacterium]
MNRGNLPSRRRLQYGTPVAALAAVFAVLFTAALAVALVFVARYSSATEAYKTLEHDAESISESAEAEISSLEVRIIELEREAAKLQKEKNELISSFADSDKRYKELLEQISNLEARLEEKQLEINRMREDLERLGRVYKVDMSAQFEIISELEELLKNGAPPRRIKTLETTETGEEVEVTVEEYPKIALFYQDITRGYTYSYNDGEVFYSASCLKAPFALSLLEAATAEITGSAEKRVYDFDEIYTYTAADAQTGSGIITKQPEGTEYTYLELIELLLSQSDNVAYAQLKKKYGTDGFRALASRLGTTAMRRDLSTMTASDGGKVMLAIYEFISGDSPYAQFMYDAMVKSNHRVLIPAAVPGKPVAHKYGWDVDAYHDMGIVFDKNPYVVVILTNLDEGGSEVDDYIRSVLKLVDRLHQNFYK